MRKTVVLLVTMTLVVLLASGVALAATRIGDDERNHIYGTNRADTLVGMGGNDFMAGRGGADKVFGGEKHDVVIGGFGADFLDGGDGDDTIVEHCQYWATRFLCGGWPPGNDGGIDEIHGGDGYDVILAGWRDHPHRDIIFCGDGRDLVYADSLDSVGADCERVRQGW